MTVREPAQEHLAAFFANAQDVCVILDPSGKILSLNPAMATVFGYDPRDLVGQPISLLLPPELREAEELELILEVARSGGSLTREQWICINRDGQPVPVRMTAIGVESPEPVALLMFSSFRGEEKLKELQEELVRMQDLALIGELAASVAHEIRNPLASILAAVENLRDELRPVGESADSVRKIIGQIQRLNRTIERLLTFSRDWTPEAREYDLADLIREILDSVKSETAAREIQLDLHYPSPCKVVGDSQMIEHALSNIVHNAVQALSTGGVLIVQVAVRQEEARIVVKDNGPGIPVENLASVVRPFFSTKSKGAGLGLAITKKMIEAHRGSIKIESNEGEGTEVTISFPRVYC
jgi:PAS domain S-box-containing protein